VKKKFVVFAVILAVLAAPVLAFLGVGDIVYDPSNFQEAVQHLVQLERQYAQLVQTYLMIQRQYNQMTYMARPDPVNMIARYRALATLWRLSSATNTYGTTAGWITGINTGLAVPGGYSAATLPLGTYGAALGNVPGDQVDRVKTSYATIELTDGANLAAMQALGELRANAPAVEGAIQGLEADSLSADPLMNTEIAVLNKINAAGMINIRDTQDTNKLLVALTEHQIIEAKRTRDAEASAINNHIQFTAQAQSVMAAQAADASSAMLNWRMP
jgi:hypothetical protein